MADHAWIERFVNLLRDSVSRSDWYTLHRHTREGAMRFMGTNAHFTGYALLAQRCQSLCEHPLSCIPAQLWLEHLADSGQWHRIDLGDLRRHRGSLRRPLAHPVFQLTRRDLRAGLQLNIGHRQFPRIGV